MEKWIVILLALALTMTLSACSSKEDASSQQITLGADLPEFTKPQETIEAVSPEAAPAAMDVFSFTYADAEIVPGNAFDASKLPEAASVYQVPSCALEGTDNVYNYEAFEVTACDEGNGEFVYSIYFIDPNLATSEGLALGDALNKAESLYGSDYEHLAGEYIYTRGDTQLRLIAENDTVVSIEFRMVIEY